MDLQQSNVSNRKRKQGSRPLGESAHYLVMMEEMALGPPGLN